jgi:drug/metabolite transporter (DMT)-like permease
MRIATEMERTASKYFWQFAPFIFVMFWSGGYTFAKLGLAYIEPMTMLAVRYGIAVCVLLPFVLWFSKPWPASVRHWVVLAITGFLLQCIYFGLSYLAFKKGMNAGTAAVIMSLQPILVAVLGPSVIRGRGGRYLWAGLIVGFIGAVLVTMSGNSLGPSPWVAVFLALIALAGITFATLFEKWHGIKTDPMISGFVQYIVGFVFLMPVAIATETMVIDWHPELIISLAYLVIANSIISVGIYIALLQRGDATSISSLLYLVPPLAMFIAWAVLGEAVTKLALVGFALSAAGVYIVSKRAS